MSRRAAVAIWFIVLAMSISLWGCAPRPLDFVVLFENARGLLAGDPLLLNGVPIGKVSSIELSGPAEVRVHLRVRGDQVPMVRERCHFHIEPPSATREAGKSVVMTSPAGAGAPLAEHSIVRGDEPFDLRAGAEKASRDFHEFLDGLQSSQSLHRISAELKALSDTVLARGRRLDASDLERLRQRGDELARRLERAGQSEKAAEARRQLSAWLQQAGRMMVPDSVGVDTLRTAPQGR